VRAGKNTGDKIAGARVTIFSYMSLVVVGSVAYDGVETPHGKVDRMLAARHLYFAGCGYFTSVRIVAVVGMISRRKMWTCWPRATSTSQAWSASREARRFSGGRLLGRHERPHHAAHRPQRVRRFQPQTAAVVPLEPYLFLGNIQPTLQRNVRAQMSRLKLTGATP